ncbi:MAG: DNA primase, partial [Gammaproteobacteria bacterium]|nr:DNA primase [Gammaproteobacteria bacterium]
MAGLIPQSFIDDLLDRVDIVEVIDRRVPLKKAGRSYKACCPFHDEKTPSFNVNPDKQFYHCFGCGAGGNAVGFLMDYENVDFPTAIESLATLLGIEVPHEAVSEKQQQQRRKTQSIYDVLNFASRYYQTQLRKHPQRARAVDYIKNRGISGEMARDFALGFAPAGWDNLLQAAKQAGFDKQQLAQLEAGGMLVKKENGDYYDRFRERIIFPIRDNRGRIIAFGGRVLGDDKPKYLNSPETAVFHKQRELYGLYEARKSNAQLDYLILVEGYMDVLALFQRGISNALATLGTASNIQHLEKIFRHTGKLVVCFDGDDAGKKAAQRLLETALPAMQDGREIVFLFLPAGEDPDSFIKQQGKDAFIYALDQATPLETELFRLAAEGVSLDSEAGKARFVSQALPLIKPLPAGVFKQRMLGQLAERAGVNTELLEQKLAQIAAPRQPGLHPDTESTRREPAAANVKPKAGATSPTPANKPEVSARTPVIWALSILLHFPEFAREVEFPSALADAQSAEGALLAAVVAYIQSVLADEDDAPTTYRLLGHWYGTPESQLLSHCAASHSPPEDAQIALQE